MQAPAAGHTLSASGRAASIGTALLQGTVLPASQASKACRQQSAQYRQFWLDASKTAASHHCYFRFPRQSLHELRCAAREAEVASLSSRGKGDLLIVGPGVLGGLLGRLWKEANPSTEVVGQTNSNTNHERLRKLGLVPRLKQDATERAFPNVVFSAPPSGSLDYVAEVKSALELWDRTGTFVFTSSSAVFNPRTGEAITEDTPLHPPGSSERIDRLLSSEKAVLEAGGCVVRFVGLYHANRGAHTFFLRQGEVARWGGHIVNLIHYEDAALLCLKVLQAEGSRDGSPYRKCAFLGTDAEPLTFQEMMDATLASGEFHGEVRFTGPAEQSPASASANHATRNALKWAPKFASFKQFMQSGARDFYTSSEAFS